ncbi:hypothetical protein HN51_060220 [Arachis hypogaea]|nr:uncharacterized protein LOC107624083 isoform X1 [Arachis ipaensis]XP_016182016.1 uncharacterized protein LOC107624083 isoform X1 [Arachis ipaensis]XP_016182017.1 uncharacterized protein LOC107624083 isoform X1 [Arachis ipaensis]XP_025684409.1 uncharacterized protein LOC112785180 [Arachis hypogaea]XP_029151902.1 uncharacterized protein LOC112785180 [Arachis hypogaea]QHN83810.1 uncharacterized protein DS421_20g708000 [Arachis hypogaea]QHN83811.1 uncharacterized protein DS421_20g708000 [Arach
MEKKRETVEYRERLDNTLASPHLTNYHMLKNLVQTQLLHSSKQQGDRDNLVETKTAELSNFLDMLRSVSEYSEGSSTSTPSRTDWKIKQDNEEFRVMYREGPEGTPFHSLLAEGYVDGPVDVCLCLSWETPLYNKWWPHIIVPTFKITAAECLQKIQIGEQISLVRMKLSWPLSTREAIVHYYLFEYYQDDLVVVLLNSVSDSKSITGFNSDVIPDAKDAVRIDVVGGFALQKVTPERSYFRTIANLDIKLDFVPPSLINFISRQLVGSGFRLYQKAVASMMKNDELSKVLEEPLYVRVHQALYSSNSGPNTMEGEDLTQVTSIHSADDLIQSKHDGGDRADQHTNNFNSDEIVEVDSKEIVEADNKEIVQIEEEEEDNKKDHGKRNVYISSEVRQALETLEKAISVVREHGFQFHSLLPSATFASEGSIHIEKGGTVDSNSAKQNPETEAIQVPNSNIQGETSQEEPVINSEIPNSRHTGANAILKEVNYNKVVPASPSPEQNLSRSVIEASHVDWYSLKDREMLNHTRLDNKQLNTATFQDLLASDDTKKPSRKEKHRYCCFLH